MTQKIGPNDPCPCGSGKKYKKCCKSARNQAAIEALRRTRQTRRLWLGILATLGVAAAAWGLVTLNRQNAADRATSSASAGLTPRPLGPAPPGKVWSPEHGHWHDIQPVFPASGGAPVPQPPGPVPAGKVWSADHGHWHDIQSPVGAQPILPASGGAQVPQPPGPVPPGKVWSADHGHWHDIQSPVGAQPVLPALGGAPVPQPPGPVPPGKVWSADHGHWHDL